MKKYILVMIVCVFLVGCGVEEKPIEEVSETEAELTIEEAIEIAQGTECTEKGSLTESYFYNENSKTWWIDLEMDPEFENKICNPACVVFEETKEVEINWRCTGALPPEE